VVDFLSGNLGYDEVDDQYTGRRRKLYLGKWVWWDRESGDVGVIPSIDFILNFDVGSIVKHWRF
jgi:hypothetical protein